MKPRDHTVKEARQKIRINSHNFDLTIRRSWNAELIRHDGSLLELVGEFEIDVDHLDLGHIERGTISYEYYWLDRWYNIFRFHEPTGEFRNYYCNINLPPVLEDNVLDYVDLDIDVLIDSKGIVTILDLDEFEENSRQFSISEPTRSSAFKALDELISVFSQRKFPFDPS
jgi:protein associated with RNAse G/E